MSKIKRITVSNLKAVSALTATFDGCTAIITGKNNAGKTSFLRGLFDRVRGTKADAPLKTGETEGFAEATLTTGERIKWEFNDKGKEKLTYFTEKDIKTPMSLELRNRFFPETFDVDKFLNDQPAKQRKTLQDLAGLDFTDIDIRYDIAYKERTAANTRASDAKTLFDNTPIPVKFFAINVTTLTEQKEKVRGELNKLYISNKESNKKLRDGYMDAVDEYSTKKQQWENEQSFNHQKITECRSACSTLETNGFDVTDVLEWINNLPQVEDKYSVTPPVEPTYPDELPDNAPLREIEDKIDVAHQQNIDAGKYSAWLQLQTNKNETAEAASKANKAVLDIETERTELIKTAKMPEGFTFTTDGIAYNGLAFTREQLSSSGIYIAALKLASMKIGEIRTLHFDASFLDKNSLAEIETWAASQDLQLLIERPDFEGGEIEYQLIQQ